MSARCIDQFLILWGGGGFKIAYFDYLSFDAIDSCGTRSLTYPVDIFSNMWNLSKIVLMIFFIQTN